MPFVRPSMPLLVWALIAAAGFAAGWWNMARARAAFTRTLVGDARRCALAFRAEEIQALGSASNNLGGPAYLSVKSRLAALKQASPPFQFACIFRHLPDSGKIIFLADSEAPGASFPGNPGDEYRPLEKATGLQSILRGGQAALDGPLAGPAGARVSCYALIEETSPAGGGPGKSRAVLRLDLPADVWRRALGMAGLRAAVLTWLLLGFPFGLILAIRHAHQRDDLVRKLAQAIEQNHSGVVILGPDRRIEHINAGFCGITGWRREDLLGQHARLFVSSEISDEQLEKIFAAVMAGRTWRGEILNRRKDGSSYPARSIISPVHGREGRLTHIITVVEDVSERKQVEAALVYAKERAEAGEHAKGRFLAMMSHEIRTPLNGIIGFASLALDTPLTPEQRECIQTIRASGESLLQLTNDLLDFSKIGAGRLHLDPRPCDPRECVESAFELLASRAVEKKLDLLHDVDPRVPPAVMADADRLRQVLINLVGNAIKFTAAGEVEVTVRAEPRPGPTAAPAGIEPGADGVPPVPSWLLRFAVRDTGIGIAPEEQEKLFKPFSQIDVSSTRKYGGAGLGLAISRSLVQMMGGDITVESAAGRGAVFTFTVLADGASAAEEAKVALDDRPVLKELALAVVVSSEPFRRELERLLRRWGARPVGCSREQLAAAEWDAAVVDLAPPEAESWRQMLKERPDLSSRPLVAFVPVDFPAAGYNILRPYFRAFVRKPPRHNALHALFAATLQPREAAPPPPAAATAQPFGGALGLRVLLVEDNPVNQRLAQKILENLGCHWDLAEDGSLALERLRCGSYDLVLLDLHLPDVDGVTLVEAIRRGGAEARNQNIWITALTTDAQELPRRPAAPDAPDDYVTEPFKPADLAEALKRGAGPTLPAAAAANLQPRR